MLISEIQAKTLPIWKGKNLEEIGFFLKIDKNHGFCGGIHSLQYISIFMSH